MFKLLHSTCNRDSMTCQIYFKQLISALTFTLSIRCFIGVFFRTDRRLEPLCDCSIVDMLPFCRGVTGDIVLSNICRLNSSANLTLFPLSCNVVLLLKFSLLPPELKSSFKASQETERLKDFKSKIKKPPQQRQHAYVVTTEAEYIKSDMWS